MSNPPWPRLPGLKAFFPSYLLNAHYLVELLRNALLSPVYQGFPAPAPRPKYCYFGAGVLSGFLWPIMSGLIQGQPEE